LDSAIGEELSIRKAKRGPTEALKPRPTLFRDTQLRPLLFRDSTNTQVYSKNVTCLMRTEKFS